MHFHKYKVYCTILTGWRQQGKKMWLQLRQGPDSVLSASRFSRVSGFLTCEAQFQIISSTPHQVQPLSRLSSLSSNEVLRVHLDHNHYVAGTGPTESLSSREMHKIPPEQQIRNLHLCDDISAKYSLNNHVLKSLLKMSTKVSYYCNHCTG